LPINSAPPPVHTALRAVVRRGAAAYVPTI
jgi:hypothetical protein